MIGHWVRVVSGVLSPHWTSDKIDTWCSMFVTMALRALFSCPACSSESGLESSAPPPPLKEMSGDCDPKKLQNVFLNFILFIYFWLHWVFVAARRLSLVVASGGSSSPRCTGFSLRWLLSWRSTGSRHAGSRAQAQ